MSVDPNLVEAPYPLEKVLGYRLTDWSEGYAVVELPLRSDHANRQGLPHGGVHATLMDTAMGYCGCYTGDSERKRMALTLSLTINYLSRPTGQLLRAFATQTGGGRSTYFASAELRDETNILVATSTGVFRYRNG